jgi:hypothetical protein
MTNVMVAYVAGFGLVKCWNLARKLIAGSI